MISEEELKELSALADKATPGPWKALKPVYCDDRLCVEHFYEDTGNWLGLGEDDGTLDEDDARFIAATREAVPKLIAEIRRLQADRTGMFIDIPEKCCEPWDSCDLYSSNDQDQSCALFANESEPFRPGPLCPGPGKYELVRKEEGGE